MKDKTWVYDIEVYKNFFSLAAYNVHTEEKRHFVVWKHINEYEKLLEWLKMNVVGLIGFNNVNYDYPILHKLIVEKNKFKELSSDDFTKIISNYSNWVINEKFSAVKPWQVIIPQLDLFLIHHFNNKARTCSLKDIEVALRWKNIQDLPYHFSSNIETEEQVNNIIDYNYNDVYATHAFYVESKDDIELRKALQEKYNISLLNANGPKIGSEIFLHFLSKELQIPKPELRKMRTFRSEIDLNECIVPYISFQSETFNDLLVELKNKTIKETKGAINKEINYKDFEVTIGTGGMHGCIKPGVYRSDGDHVILDIDVVSYYPNLAIKNKFYPAHLGISFCKIYQEIFNERMKHPKGTASNAGLKLALVGAFGKSNDKYSFFYDPKYFLKITMNGQLLLVMLMERLMDEISNIQMLQINTDGLTLKANKHSLERIHEICKEWEETTRLTLEYVNYDKMIIRDVNNYIAVYEDGKTKEKGFFEINRDWHKDHSMKVVRQAIFNYYVKDVPIGETFAKADILDFCKSVRMKGQNKLEKRDDFGEINEPLQKTNRYYVSNEGHTLMKVLPPLKKRITYTEKHRQKVNKNQMDIFDFCEDVKIDLNRHTNIEAGWKCILFNQYKELQPLNNYDINYGYYFNECDKILDVI